MRINQITGLRRFLESWDNFPHNSSARVPVKKGRLGNVNLDGKSGSLAASLTRHHPQFFESLEDGVRDLVVCLVERLGCITYSSCAGHASEDGQSILRERNVDIVPRDAEEYQVLKELLLEALSANDVTSQHVSVRLNETVLESDDLEVDCLDIQFFARTKSAELYFAEVDEVYESLLRTVEHVASRHKDRTKRAHG